MLNPVIDSVAGAVSVYPLSHSKSHVTPEFIFVVVISAQVPNVPLSGAFGNSHELDIHCVSIVN